MWTSSITTPANPLLTMGGGIDVDATAVISGLIFLALMIVLQQLLFKPYLRIVDQRESMTEGAGAEATAAEEQAASKDAEYTRGLEAARVEASKIREELRSGGKTQEETIIAAARTEAAAFAARAKQSLDAQATAAAVQVEGQAKLLAAAIVSRTAPEA
jgi:F-type H+-transporting ATPase subunit b